MRLFADAGVAAAGSGPLRSGSPCRCAWALYRPFSRGKSRCWLAAGIRECRSACGLQREPPARVRFAVGDGKSGVGGRGRAVHGLQEAMGEGEAVQGLRIEVRLAGRPASVRRPVRCFNSVPALGLTQIQSMPRGTGRVPLVSMAMVNPCACRASISAASTCSIGSPPVRHDEACTGSRLLGARKRWQDRRQSRSLPPPAPSVPTKSVSQKWHSAVSRSSSRPDHRLQPAKRQKTAARPAFAPSPCSV